ncbi:MAG: RNA polymerase sigma factor [Bacillota bacterium]|nr:MAG: RNA polymerase sigma factor [Bacillota bacterium]
MWRRKATRECPADIAALVARAQRGDAEARNNVIDTLSAFALGVARGAGGRSLDRTDDEYSIALLALNEAIDAFDITKGASFQTFAGTVIQRRLIDLMRKRARIRELPRSSLITSTTGEEYEDIPAEVNAAEQRHRDVLLVEERRLEIEALSVELAQFGLSFADLPSQTPKHTDARATAISLAAALVADGALWEDCLRKKLLPVAALCERKMLSRKTVERHRKYIVAVALVLGGDYPMLRHYVGVRKSE